MFNTYIYGTPLGFDFFEDISSLKDYFKGLYISTRKGRRLMVNRRDNGETFYNYLRYGLAEKEGRPNSFFGMSVSIDNNEYAYDFKEIFDWFDYLFEKLVERGSLFFVNAGNIIQYKVSKFKDTYEEIQWLKNNIPNLFTKAQGISLLEYDSTFSSSLSAQIRCFNDNTSTDVVVDAFRKFRWIALSPNFKPEEEPIEIDVYDIDSQLNRYNQLLVPIAISPKQENLSILSSIESYCSDIIHLVQKYLSSEHDENEQKECKQLIDRAQDTISHTRTIISKIKNIRVERDDYDKPVSYRVCNKCGRQLPLSFFDSQNSNFCHDCVAKGNQNNKSKKKKCIKCGNEKALSEFPTNAYICYDCKESKSIWEYIDSKVIAIACIVVLIAVVSLYLIFGGENTAESKSDGDPEIAAVIDATVDTTLFNSYVEEAKFIEAYTLVEGKKEENVYINKLNSKIQDYLWKLIDEPGNTVPVQEIKRFFILNRSLVTILHIDENTWVQCANAYIQLMKFVQLKSLTQNQRNEAIRLIQQLPNDPEIRKTFKESIENIPNAEQKASQEIADSKKATTMEAATVVPYIDLIFGDTTERITKISGKEIPAGTQITVKSNVRLRLEGTGSRNANPNDDRTEMTIDIEAGETVVLTAGKVQLTITGKFPTL